jgi:hypothetical protein
VGTNWNDVKNSTRSIIKDMSTNEESNNSFEENFGGTPFRPVSASLFVVLVSKLIFL